MLGAWDGAAGLAQLNREQPAKGIPEQTGVNVRWRSEVVLKRYWLRSGEAGGRTAAQGGVEESMGEAKSSDVDIMLERFFSFFCEARCKNLLFEEKGELSRLHCCFFTLLESSLEVWGLALLPGHQE